MSTILTTKFRIHNAESFKEGFNEGPRYDGDDSSGNAETSVISTNIYTGIGKITPWSSDDVYLGGNSVSSDSVIPEPLDHVQSDFEVWRNMISLKKVQPSDVSHVIPRVDWVSGKTYSMYKDDDPTLFYDYTDQPFYVMTDEFHVYKCIFNNNGSPSIEKPTSTITNSTFELEDGYLWKYMYTVSAADAFKFMTSNYIPVKKLLVNPGTGCNSSTNQWDVQNNAVDGKIEYIYRHYWETVDSALTAGLGDGYVNLSGNITEITPDGFVLDNGVQTDDYYNGATIYFPTPGGDLSECSFIIENYIGSTRTVIISGDINGKVTDSDASFQIIPTVKVEGDGEGLEAISVMSESNPNQIDKVKIINGGLGYTIASISFVSAEGQPETRSAKFSVAISPRGGHGSDPVRELGGYYIMLNTKFNYNESNLPTANDFRQISLVKDPLNYQQTEVEGVLVNELASSNIYNQTKTLNLTLAVGSPDFVSDDVIVQSLGETEIARAVVVDVKTEEDSSKSLRISKISGTFVSGVGNGSVTTEDGSGANSDSINSILNEDLKPYSGEVLFVEQRRPIQRDDSQIEDVKIILEF